MSPPIDIKDLPAQKQRRRQHRIRWKPEEVKQLESGNATFHLDYLLLLKTRLIVGVARFGEGRWTDILGTGKFDDGRTASDLKVRRAS